MSTPAKKTASAKAKTDKPFSEEDRDPKWLFFRHQETDGTTRAPNRPGVLAWFLTRGWLETAPVDDDTPISVPPRPEDDFGEWVTLYHPGVDSIHDFPNNAGALAGARESGWTDLPKDGSYLDVPGDGSVKPLATPTEEKEGVKTDG